MWDVSCRDFKKDTVLFWFPKGTHRAGAKDSTSTSKFIKSFACEAPKTLDP